MPKESKILAKENQRKTKADFGVPTKKKSGTRKLGSVQHYTAIKHVYNDLLLGATDSMVANKLQEDTYEIGKAYTHDYSYKILQEAKQMVISDMESELQNIRIGLMAKAYDTYTDARENGDRTNAIAALNFISKITGALDPRYGQTNVQNITIDFHFDGDEEDNKDEEYEDVNEC